MGILINRQDDLALYGDIAKEVSFILDIAQPQPPPASTSSATRSGKLSESKLAKKLGMDETTLKKRMAELGYFKLVKNSYELTEKGLAAGGEWQAGAHGGRYRVWPAEFEP